MQPIPDTGGGLSGFLAHGLWHVYRFFPFEGTWDWLLLCFLLTAAIRLLFLPRLWSLVRTDMQTLAAGASCHKGEALALGWSLFDLASMWFLVWLFHTRGGRTFLDGRTWFLSASPTEVDRLTFWTSLIVQSGIAVTGWRLYGLVVSGMQAFRVARSTPYPDRSLFSLYSGGGAFKFSPPVENAGPSTGGPNLAFAATVICLAHVFYWYWSVASLVIMLCFVITGVLSELVRMVFVYVHHKRMFG